jgi:hypothetical protein
VAAVLPTLRPSRQLNSGRRQLPIELNAQLVDECLAPASDLFFSAADFPPDFLVRFTLSEPTQQLLFAGLSQNACVATLFIPYTMRTIARPWACFESGF